MTITLQAVNELIASLESAGEPSIREQKFLKLAKEFRICSASLDAAIKTGNMLADQNAQLAAENVALKSAVDHTIEWIESTNGDPCDVVILKGIRTPATDRIVAGIKADGVEMVLDLIGHTKGMLYADSVKEMLSDVSSKLREGADK
ncbi:TPA: hypothetical protein MM028_000196 [Klebsiella pneumoniae]|nr:hypothetical protein [Klebsiella pneumoniae]HBZ7492573.1 hypothetical protein [Klebsiella pneumoniae]